MRSQAEATQLVENERIIVTRFTFEPGAETGWHVHGHDYVIVAVTDCRMLLELPGGETAEADVAAGEAYARPKGVSHNVINRGDARMCFVETELKEGGPEARPTSSGIS